MLKRYEQTTRVVTAFYAVLLGFGLKHLLDNDGLQDDRWLYLILASLFFLRFLLGSANHLWIEYVRPDPVQISEKTLLFDVFLLMAFGVIGLIICYQSDSIGFLTWNAVLGVLALAGATVYAVRGARAGRPWSFWLWINLAQTASALGALALHAWWPGRPKVPCASADGVLAVLCLVYLALFLTDLHKQLKVLAAA